MAWAERFTDFMDHSNVKDFRPNKFTLQSRDDRPTGNRTSKCSRESRFAFTREKPESRSIPNLSCPINNISSNMSTVSIVGVVIAKAGPKAIMTKKGLGNERHLISLTVRDAPMSFINVSCWGSIDYANHITSFTSVGDVVEIKDSQVQPKSNPADDKFKPWTPSSVQLVVSENHGSISPYTAHDMHEYASLVHMPPRASNDYHSLEEVQAAGMKLQEVHVNIMAVVKKVWPKKTITTKRGQKTSKVDITLFDETCLSFDLTLWDPFVDIVDRLIPLETVIFATDVKILFNEYKSAMVAYSDSKSIFTTDPDTTEASILNESMKTQVSLMTSGMSDFGMFSCDGQDPDVDSITNVLTIQNIKSLQTDPDYFGKTTYGIVYACLTSFDVDGDDQTCVRNICPSCYRTVQKSSDFICTNANCLGGNPLLSRTGVEYNITVNLSDHTGTLNLCFLQPAVAKGLLGFEAGDFSSLNTFQQTAIKWKFLFERVKAVLKIKVGDGNSKNGRSFTNVLAMTKTSTEEMSE